MSRCLSGIDAIGLVDLCGFTRAPVRKSFRLLSRRGAKREHCNCTSIALRPWACRRYELVKIGFPLDAEVSTKLKSSSTILGMLNLIPEAHVLHLGLFREKVLCMFWHIIHVFLLIDGNKSITDIIATCWILQQTSKHSKCGFLHCVRPYRCHRYASSTDKSFAWKSM